jgi:L-serine dehydratase
MSYKNIKPPFLTSKEMTDYNKTANLNLYELAEAYECSLGSSDKTSVFNQMLNIVNTLKTSIKAGINGTTFEDRILGSQSVEFNKMMKNNLLPDVGMLNNIIHYVTVLMEVKSSMGVIVAAPTAGSCGALPGTVIAAAEYLGKDDNEIAKAMLVAGLVGVFICNRSTFAAEVCGCQAECGAGSGMTAAALVYLFGGDVQQSISAASMSIQNILGLVCDPVANRVEAPCLGRNIMAASNALSTASTILAGYDPLIPLDEVIQAMDETGKSISHKLRCTALGGLSITPTSKMIEFKLNRKNEKCST